MGLEAISRQLVESGGTFTPAKSIVHDVQLGYGILGAIGPSFYISHRLKVLPFGRKL